MAILGLGRAPANIAGGFAGTNSPSRLINSALTMGNREWMEQQGGARVGTSTGGARPPSAADRAEASWQEAMRLLQRQGPYTPEVVNQLTNRRADQTAAAEAVNAEEIRNTAAARGMDPTQALRQMQQARQASNVAFSGDIASQGAIQNFAAETPGRMAAAQANLQRSFTGGSAPAVTGGGGMRATTAFTPQSSGYNPGAVHQQAATMNQTRQPVNLNRPTTVPSTSMSVADRNAAQAAWDKSTNYGRDVYGPNHQPGAGGAGVSRDQVTGALNATATKPNLRQAPTAFAPQTVYANGRQYGAVQTYGY